MKTIDTELFVEALCEIDPEYDNEIKQIEQKFDCTIDCSIEKHNALQLTYYYEVDFKEKKLFYVEIESGINNGTQLNSAEWGVSTKEETTTAKVLKDIKLDSSYYADFPLQKKKAQAILDANKGKLFEFHRQNSYDNYVTGGNSKMKLDKHLNQLHLDYVYDEIEVDRNFI